MSEVLETNIEQKLEVWVLSKMAIENEKTGEKFDNWKYANLEKASFFRKKFPGLKATDQEIENAAYSVYQNKENGFTNLDVARKSPVYHKLMKLMILEGRDENQLPT